jgi:hypothetical protein
MNALAPSSQSDATMRVLHSAALLTTVQAMAYGAIAPPPGRTTQRMFMHARVSKDWLSIYRDCNEADKDRAQTTSSSPSSHLFRCSTGPSMRASCLTRHGAEPSIRPLWLVRSLFYRICNSVELSSQTPCTAPQQQEWAVFMYYTGFVSKDARGIKPPAALQQGEVICTFLNGLMGEDVPGM